MEKKQLINCGVCSCQFCDEENQRCKLTSIEIRPCSNNSSGNPEDESMCGSYKCNC